MPNIIIRRRRSREGGEEEAEEAKEEEEDNKWQKHTYTLYGKNTYLNLHCGHL